MKTVRYLCTREFESLLCRSSFGFFFGSLVPRVPIRRFESPRARDGRRHEKPARERRCHPSAAVTTHTLCERVSRCDSEFELVMASRSSCLSHRLTPPLRTQTANAPSHSKFVKCLPRGEDYNAIEYAREELAALQKTRSQGKFRHERTHSSTRSRPATLLDGQTELTAPRRCSTAKHS